MNIPNSTINLKRTKHIFYLINYEDNGWPEGYQLVGFQYVDFLIENGDIYYLSRTAINGAHNYHDLVLLGFFHIR
jgi:hypothetical protein